MRRAEFYLRSGWFHLLAFAALATFFTTSYFAALAEDETRVHAVHCTFIFHIGGQIVIRTPDDRLRFCNFFTHVEPDFILRVCGMCEVVWLAVVVLRILDRFRKKEPRGFEVIQKNAQK